MMEGTCTYPSELEQAWVAIAARFVRGGPPHDLGTFEADVARISDLLTTEREPHFGRYAFDGRSLAAYGLYFFPQTYARMALALEECLAGDRWAPPTRDRPLRLLDLGAGTGAATFAALFAMERRCGDVAVHVDAVDASADGLGTLSGLFDAVARPRWPRAGLTCRAADLRAPRTAGEGGYDLVLASFVLNELMEGQPLGEARPIGSASVGRRSPNASPLPLGVADRGNPEAAASRWMGDAVSLLAPGGLLLITEPVSRETSERLERLRDDVAAAGQLDIVAPCLHREPCPLLAAAEVWCHEVRRWAVPDTVTLLNRRLHRSVETVKFSMLAVARRTPLARYTPDAHAARLVGPIHARKGRVTTWGCAADGRVHPYEVQTRSLDRAAIRAAERMERGSRVTWGGLHLLGDGTTLRANALPRVELH